MPEPRNVLLTSTPNHKNHNDKPKLNHYTNPPGNRLRSQNRRLDSLAIRTKKEVRQSRIGISRLRSSSSGLNRQSSHKSSGAHVHINTWAVDITNVPASKATLQDVEKWAEGNISLRVL